MSEESRYVEYVGEFDIAKVEENPFNDGLITCMLLQKGHLQGRDLEPAEARELGESLIECADQMDE